MEQTITVSGKELIELNPGFGSRFGPVQVVDVVYCNDRSSPIWKREGEASAGFMAQVLFQENVRAYAQIYVYVVKGGSPGARVDPLGSGQPGAFSGRAYAVETLVHELVHVEHGWLHGGQANFDQVYAKEYQRARTALLKQNPFLGCDPARLNRGAYHNNVFESLAFRRAREFVAACAAKIRAGAFDRYLPSWVTAEG